MEVEQVVTPAGKRAMFQFQRMSSDQDRVRVKKKTLEAVLGECRRALELLSTTGCIDGEDDDDDEDEDEEEGSHGDEEADDNGGSGSPSSSARCRDEETAELCDLIKSRVECADFLEKLESAQTSVPQSIAEEGASWDMVNENDLWEGGNFELNQEDYVLVRQEDIVDGIACFIAAYLLSLKQTKELTPNQLQEALCKTLSVKKKKGKLRKAWDGSQVIYNVASWGATAVGIYQNPAILKVAFWTSCRVISKLF